MRLFVALHHHRHGLDVNVYDVDPGITFTADDAVERLGEAFEANREDEWVEVMGPVDIIKVESK